jgi:FAD:protein FMN transferase
MNFALSEHRFRAMNTDVAAWLWSDSPASAFWLHEIEAFFGEVEAELSRFRPESGLSRLNASAGRGPQPVSDLVQTVLAAALRSAEDSEGIFDPTVLGALHRAGYVRSFELLADGSVQQEGEAGDAVREDAALDWRAVALDRRRGEVTLPAGLGLDLGGIAKGWAVDRAAEMLGAWGAALVDAGGDIRASAAPGGEPWPIGIQDPFDPAADLGVLDLSEGAVATSTVGRRRWQHDGRLMHHLIDPQTGEPSRSDLHTVTVIAPTAADAEVAAKVALILGAASGRTYLEARGRSALLVDQAGGTHVVGAPCLARPLASHAGR